MAAGNFSNGGLDTFDPAKRYIGIRLQQAVPLLDRDWNELEDIRRWSERTLVEGFVGTGANGLDSFRIAAPGFPAPKDVVIKAGQFSFQGYHLVNEDDILYSEQGDGDPLPTVAPGGKLRLYLEVHETRIDATIDPDLANTQDVNMETCLRDRLDWAVHAVADPADQPPGTQALADVTPGPAPQVTTAMISDLRPLALALDLQTERLDALTARLDQLEADFLATKADVESLKFDVGRLFWEVDVSSTTVTALFGGKVTLSMRAVDRHGTPVSGATLSLSTDFGTLQPSVVTTKADGRASATLIGVEPDIKLSSNEIAQLGAVIDKVTAATLPNPGSIQYSKVQLEPSEMALVSKYAPASQLYDLASDMPNLAIVAEPMWRTATVTVHAKEQASVRGTGSIQVTFGYWVRDWALTKLWEVASTLQVGAQVGDLIRQHVVNDTLDHLAVAQALPTVLQSLGEQTRTILKTSLFADPDLDDDQLLGTGALGQVISQEATAAIGAKTDKAISTQVNQLTANQQVEVSTQAKGVLHQAASQATAGLTQSAKQMFSQASMFG